MSPSVLAAVLLVLNLAILVIAVLAWRRSASSSITGNDKQTSVRLDSLDQAVQSRMTALALQLEQTRGGLHQEITRQFAEGLSGVRSVVEAQLATGRQEQAGSLANSTTNLEGKFDQLTQRQVEAAREARDELRKSLEAIRGEVDRKLNEITGQVQEKLDKNIKEGFQHFEAVQAHLKSAEEQLRNVGTLGNSIHDLNNLLKLPHLRGKFGEASLERLLHDFLPAHMFTLQSGPAGSSGRADAMVHFPGRDLPIDAKFPREQVAALFESESASDAEMAEARRSFERVMKEQAKRVKSYIQPEGGTTDMALMYLPSETLFMEAVRNRELSDELNRMKVFPVSPNTLMVTLNAVHMVHRWYKVQEGLAKGLEEFNKAKASFTHFESKFKVIGKSLEKAQDAYSTAFNHLSRYKTKVTLLAGAEDNDTPELPAPSPESGNGDSEAKNLSAKV